MELLYSDLIEAVTEFQLRRERHEVRSTYTYGKFKKALEI